MGISLIKEKTNTTSLLGDEGKLKLQILAD
jgi:hypothetical protein